MALVVGCVVEFGFVPYKQYSEVEILIVKEVVHDIFVVCQLGLRDSIPLQFTMRFQAMFHLNLTEAGKDDVFCFFRTPYGAYSHRFYSIMLEVTALITVYVIFHSVAFLCKDIKLLSIDDTLNLFDSFGRNRGIVYYSYSFGRGSFWG